MPHAPAIDYSAVQRRLGRRDPLLRPVIRTVGQCTLQPNPDGFAVLVGSIISQQISTKAAASIRARLVGLMPDGVLTPRGLLALSEESLRAAGLSGNKARSLRDLAEKAGSGAVRLTGTERLSDEEVIEQLVPVRGVGRWTAEMFLIFSLGRLDVLPVGDLGLRAGVRDVYGLEELPEKDALIAIAEKWRPHRSIATWYFWRSRGPVPQSR
jgi:DNA-3-methyladenine glycosylase II